MTTTLNNESATVTLPPGPRLPQTIQGVAALANRTRALEMLRRRYGSAFTVNVPIFGRIVVLSDPSHIRELFRASPDVVDTIDTSLGRVMGPNSLFALTGDRYRAHRKLLTPPFHGRQLAAYEAIVEHEAFNEFATWPHDRTFATIPGMTRITLNVMLRAVLGADGDELKRLREMLPPAIRLGSNLVLIPVPQWDWGKWSPYGRFRRYRREYDAIVDRLIDRAHADPNLDTRDDVLALMLRSRYDDGSPMTRAEIADELITFLAAGHETTATTLAWIVERIQRHPRLLERLVADIDSGSDALLNATIFEVLRTRSAIDSTFRKVVSPTMRIGPWTLPQGQTIIANIGLMHSNEDGFPDARRFDPYRFLNRPPDPAEFIPYGGGIRRCIGAAFANMEMRVVIRTLLRNYAISPSNTPGERAQTLRVSITPSRGARVRIRPRRTGPVVGFSPYASGGWAHRPQLARGPMRGEYPHNAATPLDRRPSTGRS
jgi:cytochrome P450